MKHCLARRFGLLVSIFLGFLCSAPVSQAAERVYRSEEQRSYAGAGETVSVNEFEVQSRTLSDGSTQYDYRLDAGVVVDENWGFVGGRDNPLPQLRSIASPNRETLTVEVLGADATAFIADSAALGRAQHVGGDCQTAEGDVTLPFGVAANLPANVRIHYSIALNSEGFCVASYQTSALTFSAPSGETTTMTLRGVTLASRDFSEIQLSAVAYEGVAGGQPFSGRRVLKLMSIDGRRTSDVVWESFEALPNTVRFVPVRHLPTSSEADRPLVLIAGVDAQHAATVAALIDGAALAFAEGRSNIAFVPFVAVAYLGDQALATVANGVGHLVKGIGALTGNTTTTAVGNALTNYNGVGGGVARWIGGHAGQAVGLSQEQGRAVAGAAYDLVGIPLGSVRGLRTVGTVAGSAAQPVISRFLANNPQFNGLVRQLLVSRSGFDWASFAGTMAQNATDLMSAFGDNAVSPTPTAGQLMASQGGPRNPVDTSAMDGTHSPFVSDTQGQTSQSTAGFADVTIAGLLSFRLFDFGSEDGDNVALEVTPGGPFMSVALTNAGTIINAPGAREGTLAIIRITALNEGSLSPNTGAITVQGLVVGGNPSQQYNLLTGQQGSLRVYVVGRRARN